MGRATAGSPSSRCRAPRRSPRRLAAARAGRRALPRRARRRRRRTSRTSTGARAGARRPGRRACCAARLRLAGRHPGPGRRAGPAAADPGRPAHRPHPPLHPRPRRSSSSPADLAAEVARQARRGDGWVKLVGDWIDRDAGDLRPSWPREALAAAIAAAHEDGARVTAHTFGDRRAARPDRRRHRLHRARHRADRGAHRRDGRAAAPRWCRRWCNVENFPGFAAAGERSSRRTPSTCGDLHAAVRRRRPGGVRGRASPIFAGTDAGGGIAHGRIADEIRALHAAGLPAEAALAAGSWGARAWLGLPCIEEGAPADLVVYDADPRADLDALQRPQLMILRGRVVG